MGKATERIQEIGILPVAVLTSPEQSKPFADALCSGGIPCIEVLARAEGAFERMQEMKAAHPEMVVGAGTVLTVAQAEAAINAGADFIVSPGFLPEMLAYCQKRGVDLVPGCTSASEIQVAYNAGLRVVKFFPTKSCGDLPAMKDLSGPFGGLTFLPTGGITFDNLDLYMKSPYIAAAGGSFVGTRDMLDKGEYAEIEARCRRARLASVGFELAHVGINHASREESQKTVKLLCALLGVAPVEHSKCTFAGTVFECNDFEGPGEKGHVGFRTRSIRRAMAWVKDQGFTVDEQYNKYDAKGNVSCFYVKEQIAGFAIHFVK